MKESCAELLQWALPRLHLRWAGFRQGRRQLRKRIARRVDQLGLAGPEAYRDRLMADREEWRVLDRMCRVTISRFWRDRGTFEALGGSVLPALAEPAANAGGRHLDAWSCSCAADD